MRTKIRVRVTMTITLIKTKESTIEINSPKHSTSIVVTVMKNCHLMRVLTRHLASIKATVHTIQ